MRLSRGGGVAGYQDPLGGGSSPWNRTDHQNRLRARPLSEWRSGQIAGSSGEARGAGTPLDRRLHLSGLRPGHGRLRRRHTLRERGSWLRHGGGHLPRSHLRVPQGEPTAGSTLLQGWTPPPNAYARAATRRAPSSTRRSTAWTCLIPTAGLTAGLMTTCPAGARP